ncbi:uncharacterized protein LOC107616035 [Arachis ipaensis]|uniref:uncharacterized protein LOC107616035 n=1 Tax=Arachis ipaensis TaxID=130454 RepID=UPI0007AF8F38|nr:uncharacterized protein LOC107616035 [Arachis ipaensis]
MESEESFLVLVHSSGKIKKSKRHGVKFIDREPLSVFIRSFDTLLDLKSSILQKLGAGGTKWVKKLFYKIPIAVVLTGVQYETFALRSDEDMQVLFHCRRSFPEVRIHKLFAKLEHGIDSSGASAPNPQSTTMGGASTSMSVVAPECLLEYWPAGPDGVFTSTHPSPDVGREGEPDRVENAMLENDSNEEPADIGGDSDDEILTNPATCQPPSSAGTHDKEEVVLTVKDYNIRRGVEYRVMESDHFKYHGRCKEFGKGCTWMIRISLRARKGTWEVRPYNRIHTCLATSISSDHRQLDYHVICAKIFPLVRANAAVSIKVLQEATEGTYEFKPTYRKTWLAKQKAVAQIYKDWEESYAELPRWILGMQSIMEGTVALLKTSSVRVGDDVDDSTVYFHRLFWTFPPCVEAFRHCKPLVSIDGTHLYGKYGGTLLLAVAQDGNSNILPIAFSLVEGENAESLSFFLTNLRQHVTLQQGILVISDRHNGVKAALENPNSGWLPPHAYRAFCIWHVAANFTLSFKGTDAKRLLVNATYAKTEAEFHYWFDIMRTGNPAMCDWANRIEYDKWTQHQDGGRQFGHMTTNISECVNSVLKDGRGSVGQRCQVLPVFYKGDGALLERLQALHYPCCHAIACCAQSWLDLSIYVDEVYTMQKVFRAYQMGFVPPIPEGLWPPYDSPTVISDPSLRHCRDGRPRSTRIRNNMDEADSNRPKRCGLCRQPGHTRKSFPQRGSTVAGSSWDF